MQKTPLVDNADVTRSEYVGRMARLAREKFAPRAEGYDQVAEFPTEDFDDLFLAGMHAPCVPTQYGGLGLGPGNDTYVLWMMTKELARADMS